MAKYLDTTGVQQLWTAVTKADDAVKSVINGLELSYDPSTKTVHLRGNPDGEDGYKLNSSFDASDFVKDGMLKSVEIVTADSYEGGISYGDEIYMDSTKFLKFEWNTDVDDDPNTEGIQLKVDFLKVDEIAPTYGESESVGITQSNILYVKEVDTDVTKISETIPVAGGPLADLLNKAGITSIDANTDLQSLLFSWLCKEMWPDASSIKFTEGTVSAGLSQPSFTLGNEGTTVEVGEKVYMSEVNMSAVSPSVTNRSYSGFTYGYSEADDNSVDSKNTYVNSTKSTATISSDEYTMSRSYSGFSGADADSATSSTDASTVILSGKYLTVGEGVNTVTVSIGGPSVSVTFNAMPSYYACSNVGNTHASDGTVYAMTDVKDETTITSSNASSSRTLKVTGARYSYVGAVPGVFVVNSDSVRALTKTASTKGGTTKVTAGAGMTNVIIAFPSSWGSLTRVTDDNSLGAVITDNFILTDDVLVDGANSFTAANYKVYVYTSDIALGEVSYTVTIS